MSKATRIFSRIVTVLLALTVLPNLYFNALIYFRIDPGVGETLWGDELSISMFGPGGLYNGLLDTIKSGSGGSLQSFLPLLRPAIIAGILLALAALTLVAIAVIAAVSNKKIPILALCAVGVAFVIGAYASFGNFAEAVTDPSFSIINLLGEGFLVSLIGSFLQPEVLMLRLVGAVSMTLVIFGAVAVWTGAFLLTTPKSEKPVKKEKKRP
ncbi:MAG: hypothetical protein LBS96_00490 [Oscillospiraceae bacterium]|nr:hypothetical protein [Oscillospiraceae bacterium]